MEHPAHTLDNPPASNPVDALPLWKRFAPELPQDKVVWSEILPGGAHWGWRLSRGTALRFVALGERANCSVVLYAAHDPLDRLLRVGDVGGQAGVHRVALQVAPGAAEHAALA